MLQTPVCWVGQGHADALTRLSAGLAQAGYEIASHDDHLPVLRILCVDAFDDHAQAREAYLADPRPTLILTSSEAQELVALDFIRDRDELGHQDDSPATVARRLDRLKARHELEERVAYVRDLDALTGALSRRRMSELITEWVQTPQANAARAVVLLDLDNFKHINDHFGHAFGDRVLVHTVEAIRPLLLPHEAVARYGGEEFVVLLSRRNKEELRSIADAVRRSIGDAEVIAEGSRLTVTASAGMACLKPGATAKEVMQHADLALYEAKAQGRDVLIGFQQLSQQVGASEQDLHVRHFRNVTQVVTERVASLVTKMGESLLRTAKREANEDALTGLHNRRYLDTRLGREVERAIRLGSPLTVALMDLDNFGEVNRAYGYVSGDRVLKQFAGVVMNSVRTMDWVARYGGEEFCLVMPDTTLEQGMEIAERLRGVIAAARVVGTNDQVIPISVSIGLAQLDPANGRPDALLDRAGLAAQHAKRCGRDCVMSDQNS